ncbi:MAG: type III pantothenate kinase [Clostridia bacterium]|nr:type III pantothenate kinase [Clostridia bacterium]
MLLVIDIGNSNITLGVYDKDDLKFVARLATDRLKTGDQYAIDLRDLLHLYGISTKDIHGSIISSVVPVLGSAFKRAIRTLTGKEPLSVGPGVKTGLNIKIDNPAQLGADLAAGAVAAVKMYKLPCIVLDLGTATTISVIDKNGCFLGGAISAGIRISLDALTSRTSQLPQIGIEAPPNVIGTNTVDCMKSGLVLGCAAMIDGLCDRIEEQLGESATIVATGGLSAEVVKNCRKDIVCCDNLLLEGLKIIYEKNA